MALADGKFVLVAASASVKLHSAVTAETVQTLDGHTQDVTAIVLDDSNKEQVIACANSQPVLHC